MDLVARQNREITSAQLENIKNIKKFSDKEIRECSEMFKQVDLFGNDIVMNVDINPILNSNIEQKDVSENIIDSDAYFCCENNDNLLSFSNVNGSMIITYEQNLFDKLIEEFEKVYNILDFAGEDRLLSLYIEDGKDVVVTKEEFDVVIKFLKKMGKIKVLSNNEKNTKS